MREYKILTANVLEQAGWRVVGTTVWQPRFQIKFVIPLGQDTDAPNL